MSVTGIASTILTGLNAYQHRGQSKVQQLAGEFQQLAQDVQSGNLTQAQQDFTTLAQNIPGVSLGSVPPSTGIANTPSTSGTTATGATGGTTPATATPSSTNPLIQAFNQLGQDLQSGNLQGAQQDITKIETTAQQNVQASVQQSGHHRHHHHRVDNDQNSSQSASPASGSSSPGSSSSSLSQLTGSLDQAFGQLAQSLQSGNLQSAQQAFSALQNDLQQIGGFISSGSGSSAGATTEAAAAGSLNVTA